MSTVNEIGHRLLVRQALRGAFGVAFRKDYQLDFWLPWLEKIAQAEPIGMPDRIAAIAGSLKDLDDQTEGRATELAAKALIKVAGSWSPAAAVKLLQWLLNAGAVTHHGGSVALLTAALDAGANPLVVARLAGAWTIPFEREAEIPLATGLCKALVDTASVKGAQSLRAALQAYSLPSVRPGWADVLRRELVPTGLLVEPEVAALATSGHIREDYASSQGSLSIDRSVPPTSIDDLLDMVHSDRYVLSDTLKRVVPPIVATADVEGLLRLEAEPLIPAPALALAADELLKRGLVDHAQRLAEAALERRSPYGWDRWSDGGTILTTLELLHRLSPARCRRLAFGALHDDLLAGEVDPMSILHDLDELLPNLTDDEPALGVWVPLEEYLNALLDIPHKPERPELANLPTVPFEAALAALAFAWLPHPVTLLSQLTREASESLICEGVRPFYEELGNALSSDDQETIMSALCVLEGSAYRSPTIVSAFRDRLEDQLLSPSLDARLAASRMLGLPWPLAAPMGSGKQVPTILRLSLPSVRAWTPSPRLPEVGEPVQDSEDPLEIVGAFGDEIRWLANASQIDASTLAYRVTQIAEELGWKDRLGEAEERMVQENLRACYLEYSYVRPRARTVRVALGRAAAELLDSGLIDADTIASLELWFRWIDPALDTLPLGAAPFWLARPIRELSGPTADADWVKSATSDPRPLPVTEFGHVIAETSTVRNLDWSRPTERRRRTLVPAGEAGALAVSSGELFGTSVHLTSDCSSTRRHVRTLVSRTFPHRFGSTKPAWLSINAAVALTCGWLPDNVFGVWKGADGRPRVRSTIWMDGVTDSPSPELHAEPAHGAYIEATTEAITELEENVGQLLAIESVERDASPDRVATRKSVRRFWDWRSSVRP